MHVSSFVSATRLSAEIVDVNRLHIVAIRYYPCYK
mgnify:CR=1 FL=1